MTATEIVNAVIAVTATANAARGTDAIATATARGHVTASGIGRAPETAASDNIA